MVKSIAKVCAASILFGFLLSACVNKPAAIDKASNASRLFIDYQAAPEVIREGDNDRSLVRGVVFEDLNQNGRYDEAEQGLANVLVSNGVDVVASDQTGQYRLPVRPDMSVFVIQPSGFQVPHDENWVPQFSYQHKPNGSPKALRFGGLAPTGPIPQAINFPLIRITDKPAFQCAVLGDTQTYSNQGISYFRDSVVDDLLDFESGPVDCLFAVGDVMGDDLDLIPRMAQVMSPIQAPQWWIHGNHDLDFDADYDEDSADSWRNLYGPNYYAFEIGEVVFIALDNVVYPCTDIDAQIKGREFCVNKKRKRYNGRISNEQLAFVKNLLTFIDNDKLVVVGHHIPFVSFVDQQAVAHQTDNVGELYALLEGRKVLSLSGHTHTIENLSPGDHFAGWQEVVGVNELPFRHIIAGAASGGWYHGDFDTFGVPMALQRLGGPRGWLDLRFQGANYIDTYYGSNLDHRQRMWVSVNTPAFRHWAEAIAKWKLTSKNERDPIPPLSINDLPDVKILTPEDLKAGSYLTANVWNGSSETIVEAVIAEKRYAMQRTQTATGERARIGAEWADPFAVQRQLSVARYALQSRSGVVRNQGWEAFRGSKFGPAAPQPQGSIAERNLHLWRLKLPQTLAHGVHHVLVQSTDRHGRKSTESIVIEIRSERPPPRFRKDKFDAFNDGPPVRN